MHYTFRNRKIISAIFSLPEGKEVMQIFTNKEKDNLVQEVKGRIDAGTSPKLEEQLQGWIDQGEKALIMDMGRVEYISSAYCALF
jgi:anti-anti-sigma factor